MPTIFTFFDNSSATILPTSPSTPVYSRWSASTTTSITDDDKSLADTRTSILSTATNDTSASRSTVFPLSPLSSRSESIDFGGFPYDAELSDSSSTTVTPTIASVRSEESTWSSLQDEPPIQHIWPQETWPVATTSKSDPAGFDPLHSSPTISRHKPQGSTPLAETERPTACHARFLSQDDLPDLRQRAASAPSSITEQHPQEDYFSLHYHHQPYVKPEQETSKWAPPSTPRSGIAGKKFFHSIKGIFIRRASEGDNEYGTSTYTPQPRTA